MPLIAKTHHVELAWDAVMAQVRLAIEAHGASLAGTVVLLPYAQLMTQARSAWLRGVASRAGLHFLPRFETSMNWCQRLAGFSPGPDDLHMDAAHDGLTAASLLARAGLGEHAPVLSARLMEAAWSLARVAAAQPPSHRAAWGAAQGEALVAGLDASLLALEAATARLALAWAASASYATDVLFEVQPELLVVVQGFQTEALTQALVQRGGTRSCVIPLAINTDAIKPHLTRLSGQFALHCAQDAEDEAWRAAHCVLQHLASGAQSVALVAQDRVLTRRVRAMLGERGVALRDETGWTLSTTRRAAALMSLLKAMTWDAGVDAVLDWLKNAPGFEPHDVMRLEAHGRQQGERDWQRLAAALKPSSPLHLLVGRIEVLRQTLQAPRLLTVWLPSVRSVLQASGQWLALAQDLSGQAVLDALRLRAGAQSGFSARDVRMSLAEFTAWVSQVLEGASYVPDHPHDSLGGQVVILPLSQLLGRPFDAVVLPGCDELHLNPAAPPPDPWTAAQRTLLGLPSREQLSAALTAAWRYALRFERLDVLWRASEGGEHLMPSSLVQALQLAQPQALAPRPAAQRAITPTPTPRPQPTGERLPLRELSASAFDDLRTCPYRFFALRQLRLHEASELETELSKRDFGNWLHLVLKYFQERRNSEQFSHLSLVDIDAIALINEASERATHTLGLQEAEFLPFAATWARVRGGYLQWLATHESKGYRFVQAEAELRTQLGALNLVGKIDRMDVHAGQAEPLRFVIDYKTEPAQKTAQRLKNPLEDTQLAFYAALLSDDALGAAYVNVGESGETKTYEQTDIVSVRDALVEGVMSEMARIADGAVLPALGEGEACEYCAARGLCRKDFFPHSHPPAPLSPPPGRERGA